MCFLDSRERPPPCRDLFESGFHKFVLNFAFYVAYEHIYVYNFKSYSVRVKRCDRVELVRESRWIYVLKSHAKIPKTSGKGPSKFLESLPYYNCFLTKRRGASILIVANVHPKV